MGKREVTWGKRAAREFNAAIKYIRKDSEQNADKVKEVMLNKINALADDRVVHRKDPYKKIMMGIFYTSRYCDTGLFTMQHLMK
jgi:hypothetical protein